MIKFTDILKEILEEEKKKADRCKRIADRKFDKPSAYKSGAIVRCRKGDIWKDLKEINFLLERKYKSTKWIIDILESIKGDLIGKDYGNLEIENLLNKAFNKYRINFERGFNETTRDNWGEVGIIEGYIYENGNIYIVYGDNFYLTFEDDYLWDNFKKVCTSIISHELTHRDQFIKILKNQNYVKPVSRITNSSYLSDDKEIQAFAREALEEYIQLGYNKNQILQLIKTPTGNNKDQASKEESDSFWYYYDYFSDPQYGNPKVWKKFLKYMYQYLNTWNEDVITEDESLHKWFKRSGPKGKEGGWVDCNAPDGKGGYKACGRKEGEKRSKYPACRPTPAGCKRKGKGKTLGKTKENMIKLKDLILELDSEKIFHIEGTIIIDNQKRDVQDILSDVRALPGVTVVRNVEIPQDATSRYFRSSLEIKIDPYPYIKQNKFDGKATLETIVNNIKTIPGVIGFKQTAQPYSTDN